MLKSNPEKADAQRHTDITCPSTVLIHELTRGRLCCPISVQLILIQLLSSCNADQVTLQKKEKDILHQYVTNGNCMQVINLPFFINYRQLFFSVIIFLSLLPCFPTVQFYCRCQRWQVHEEGSSEEAVKLRWYHLLKHSYSWEKKKET